MARNAENGQKKSMGITPYTVACLLTYACGIWAGHWAAQAVAMFGFIMLPGYAVYGWTGLKDVGAVTRTAVATAIGLGVMMLIGAGMSAVGPGLGVQRPLDSGAQLVAYGFVFVLGIVSETAGKRRYIEFNPNGKVLRFLLISLLPMAAIGGAERLNRGNGGDVATAVVVIAWAMLIAVVVLAWRGNTGRGETLEAGIAGAVVSILWGSSMRGQWLFGWDIQKEHAVAEATLRAGRWSSEAVGDAYNSMLSITALPAQIHSLTGISLEYVFRFMYPLLLAGVPVLVFSMLRNRYTMRSAALATVVMVIGARAFPQQMPAISRQEIAMFLFVTAIAVVAAEGRKRGQQALFILIAGAIGFSHYTTGYTVVLMVVGSWLYAVIGGRKTREGAKRRVITLPVTVAVAGVILAWNLVIAPSSSALEQPIGSATEQSGAILEGKEKGILGRWIAGTDIRKGTVNEYADRIKAELPGELDWMVPRTDLGGGATDAQAPASTGPLAEYSNIWRTVATVLRQLILLVVACGAVLAVIRRKARRVPEAVAGMVIVAMVMNIILRTSNWAAAFYNPERGELHNSIVLSFAVAYILDVIWGIKREGKGKQIRRWFVRSVAVASVAATAMLTFDTFGLSSLTFKGAPRAATAEYGEDVERFVISDAERRTMMWMQENIKGGLIQTDRYGKMQLSGVLGIQAGVVDIMHPEYIDQNAWVYATRSNLVEGRARGYINRIFSVYGSPLDRLDGNMSILYTSENTRVYR